MFPQLQILRGSALVADGDPLAAGLCESLTLNGTAVIQVVSFLLASSPSALDRGTRANVVTFRIFQVAASLTAGLDYALRQPLAWCDTADLTLTVRDGDTAATWLAATAAWRLVQVDEVTGDTARFTCEVTCGPFTFSGVAAADLVDGGDDSGDFSVDDDIDGGSFADDDAAVAALIDGGADA